MASSRSATPEQIKDVNWRYHDAAADSYDTKWGIDFGRVGQTQVKTKLVKALGEEPLQPFEHALEIGAGTGYFCLNLLQAGLIREATATDISAGMLQTLEHNAEDLGLEASTVRTEAEELPFEDSSFDLVFGHAVLHHIPDLDRAFGEFKRVLRPGGTVAFCGEPSRYGDLLAAVPKMSARALAPIWRLALGARARLGNGEGEQNGHELEPEVDVHAFSPRDLRSFAREAGFDLVQVSGEELLANFSGWTTRTLEATAEPDDVPVEWRRLAFSTYLLLQKIDSQLLEPRLPAQLFYNLLLSARKTD